MTDFLQQLIIGLRLGSVYALVALGYTMVYGIIRLINFAHGDFIMVGGYTLYFTVPILLHSISMEVNDGKIVSLIGANGSGKTTTLHAVTGLVPIKSGSVIYDGHDLRKTDPSRIVTMGLAHVPEGRQVFTRMTVAENLAMGAYFRKDKKAIAEDLERVYARFPRLKERAKQLAGTLSGGEQQMLAV